MGAEMVREAIDACIGAKYGRRPGILPAGTCPSTPTRSNGGTRRRCRAAAALQTPRL